MCQASVLQRIPGVIQVLDSQRSKADYAELVILGHSTEHGENNSTSPGLSVQHLGEQGEQHHWSSMRYALLNDTPTDILDLMRSMILVDALGILSAQAHLKVFVCSTNSTPQLVQTPQERKMHYTDGGALSLLFACRSFCACRMAAWRLCCMCTAMISQPSS